jgi:hypothetical protein
MTTNSGFDRRAAAWLAEGPTELSDRVLDAAPWRAPVMPLRPGAAALAATLVLVALVNFTLSDGTGSAQKTANPTPTLAATSDPCGHVLIDTLELTANCAYRTAFSGPTLSLVSDGTWIDAGQSPDSYTFVVLTGKAANTTVILQMVRAVPENPCAEGSSAIAATVPTTARAYLDWLGGFLVEASRATPVEAFGFRGWQFEIDRAAPSASQGAGLPCDPVRLAAARGAATSADSLVVWLHDYRHLSQLFVLDTPQGVLLAVLLATNAEESIPAGEALLAGISAAP